MANTKRSIRRLTYAMILILILPLLIACKNNSTGIGADLDVIDESPLGYTPLLSSTKNIQMGKDCIYFAGEDRGIFKYDIATGEVEEYCTDPLCDHLGGDASCLIAQHVNTGFFRAFSDILIYSAMVRDDENKITSRIFSFEAKTIKNTLLNDNASGSNWYCLSNKYLYFNNTEVKDGVTYFNHKQISLSDRSERIFGDETEGGTPYDLIGAIGGYLYALGKDRSATYICSEEDPGEFKLFWEKPISYIWAGEDDLFFRSRDPENDDGTYYFYRTDRDGNVITRQEIIGDMRWCSFYDGRHLYYIPACEDEFINIDPDNTPTKIHWREMYCLDMQTGEREVVFTFNGDYETMALQYSMGNDMIVLDGKIYTYKIAEQMGYYDDEAKKSITKEGAVSFNKGICIIDIENGDVTHVVANYSRQGELSIDIKHYPMRLEGESDDSETTSSVKTEIPEIPEVIEVHAALMLEDTDSLPLFRGNDRSSDTPERYEVFDANGKKIDLCGSSPCTCGSNDRLTVYGNNVFTMGESEGGKTVFHAYDVSDRNNIKHSSVTVEGISTETHTVKIRNNTPYFYVRTRDEKESLTLVDMSDAINGNIKLLEYPSLDGISYTIRAVLGSVVYGEITNENGSITLIKAEAGKSQYTELFETSSAKDKTGTRALTVGGDGSLHLLCLEDDGESEHGYTLYQYIYRDGKAAERIMRAKDVCDFVISGGYFYYTVNTPSNSREFIDQDKGNVTFTDMTGGIIFRQPIESTASALEAAWSVGDYYLYGFTPNNTPKNGGRAASSTPIFIQCPEGGIAIQANKKVGGEMIHVYLLIGNTENGVLMTEIEGSKLWGITISQDLGGGTTCNQSNIP